MPSAVTGTVPGRSRNASACAAASVAVIAASTVSQACGRVRVKVAWAKIFGHCGSASVFRRSTQLRHAERPGRTSGPTTPIASPVHSARCGTRSRSSWPVRSGSVGPVRITRSGTLPSSLVLTSGAARSTVLKDSDVVMLIGARLNWLLSHGKGKTWGEAPKKFIQIDIEPKEMDSNVEIAAPVVGDIGSCVSALVQGMGSNWAAPPADWTKAVSSKREENVAKMAPRLMNNNSPMDYHGALGVLRTIIKERPDAILVNEGANTLDLARGVIDMHQPRKRIDVGTWGVMGIGMGYAVAAAIETGAQQPGKPCAGAWLAYGLGALNQNLPTFVVMTPSFPEHVNVQALSGRLWGSGFLPATNAGVTVRSSGDPVLFLKDPDGLECSVRRDMLDTMEFWLDRGLDGFRCDAVPYLEIAAKIVGISLGLQSDEIVGG